jgi:hypothetical protein
VLSTAITVLLNAVSALVGAWVGARWALVRVRQERAFDRRLVWYEQFHAVLKRIQTAFGVALVTHSLEGPTPNTREQWRKIGDAIQPLAEAAIDAEFYAPNKTIATVRRVVEDITSFPLRTGQFDQDPKAWFDAARALNDRLREASVVLAQDIREHLGLEPIDISVLRVNASRRLARPEDTA